MRVLVIDDDSVIGTLVSAVLSKEGFDVAVATDGIAGLRAAADATPDVVLVDSTMPGMAGAEVVAALRADPATTSVPVVMMSADRTAAQQTDADAELPKPFAPADLVATVRRVVPRQ